MSHDTTVEHRSEYLRGVTLPAGWEVGRHEEGTYWAAGPCPVCGGDAYGPVLPEGPGAAAREIGDVVASVRADCRCGDDHGQDGATGCGRYWVVTVESAGGDR